ncbi:hypothetical protein [Geopseudomonas aromaticivorans]
MSVPLMRFSFSECLAFFVFFCAVILVFVAYSLGFSGSFYYDDFRPLSGLSFIKDFESALLYIVSETSGPLGRPLSMLTFLFNRGDWPEGAQNILRLNALLHIANGLLVAGLAWTLIGLVSGDHELKVWLATGVGILWLILPMHVSTSLIAIQRMAGLSAFFVFSGLLFYLQGVRVQSVRPCLGFLVQVMGVGLFTLLAMFAKENGVLLPILALTLEVTLLAGVVQAAQWRRLRVGAFLLAFLILVFYLARTTLGAEAAYASRNFTLCERIITQPQILLDYLRLSFAPSLFSFHPFHDGYLHLASLSESPKGLFAAVLWALLLVLALFFRRRYPLPAFAVLWFLAAHMLESSVIGLELYFEHRNYVALFGPCLALVWGLTRVPERFKRFAVGGFVTYLLLLAFVLFQVTSLWGSREEAAKAWFTYAEHSPRAAEHYALMLLEQQRTYEAWQVLAMQAEACPQCVGSQVQAMLLSCVHGDEERTRSYYARAMALSEYVRSIGSAPSALAAIQKQVIDGACKLLALEDLARLNHSLLKLQTNGSGASQRLELTVNLHQIAYAQGNEAESLRFMQLAWQIKPDLAIGEVLVGNLIASQRFAEAQDFVANEMCLHLPANPILAQHARQRCDTAQGWINDALAKSEG